MTNREEIKDVIIQHNKKYVQIVHDTVVYNNKIYYQLEDDKVRDKILQGGLYREDYDNPNIFEFLSLLKLLPNREQLNGYRSITEKEQKLIVQRAKK